MDKCSNCYIIDRAKTAYCPDCKKVKKTSKDTPIIDILDKIREKIMDTGAYEQEVNGKTEFLKGINYCLGVIDKYKADEEE